MVCHSRCRGVLLLGANNLDRLPTAIIQDHDPAVGIFVESDEDAYQADPLDRVVEVEVDFLS